MSKIITCVIIIELNAFGICALQLNDYAFGKVTNYLFRPSANLIIKNRNLKLLPIS